MNNKEIDRQIFNLSVYEDNLLRKGVVISAAGICMMAMGTQDEDSELITAGVTLTIAGIYYGATAFNAYLEGEKLEKTKKVNKPKRLVKTK